MLVESEVTRYTEIRGNKIRGAKLNNEQVKYVDYLGGNGIETVRETSAKSKRELILKIQMRIQKNNENQVPTAPSGEW